MMLFRMLVKSCSWISSVAPVVLYDSLPMTCDAAIVVELENEF